MVTEKSSTPTEEKRVCCVDSGVEGEKYWSVERASLPSLANIYS